MSLPLERIANLPSGLDSCLRILYYFIQKFHVIFGYYLVPLLVCKLPESRDWFRFWSTDIFPESSTKPGTYSLPSTETDGDRASGIHSM